MMYNAKCSLCGADAYIGLNRTECSQPSCMNYRATNTGKDFTPQEVLEIKLGLKALVNDFAEEVAPLFLKNNWSWYRNSDYIIPGKLEIADLLNKLICMIDEYTDGTFFFFGSGRLCIRAYKMDTEILYDILLEPESSGSYIPR